MTARVEYSVIKVRRFILALSPTREKPLKTVFSVKLCRRSPPLCRQMSNLAIRTNTEGFVAFLLLLYAALIILIHFFYFFFFSFFVAVYYILCSFDNFDTLFFIFFFFSFFCFLIHTTWDKLKSFHKFFFGLAKNRSNRWNFNEKKF